MQSNQKSTSEISFIKQPSSSSNNFIVLTEGKKIVLSDVAKVAALNFKVSFDPAILKKIDESISKTFSDSLAKSSVESAIFINNSAESILISRAAIFVRIVTIMQARLSVRIDIALLLASMLNSNVIPLLTDEASAGTQLVNAIQGLEGLCSTKNGMMDARSALLEADISPVELTAFEIHVLTTSQFFTTGLASIIGAGASNLCQMLDCISSISCEVFGVDVSSFDASLFDPNRPHRGQMTSSANLRLLLEGSKCINSKSRRDQYLDDTNVFKAIPQV
jgi:histidine ammonia-lyase